MSRARAARLNETGRTSPSWHHAATALSLAVVTFVSGTQAAAGRPLPPFSQGPPAIDGGPPQPFGRPPTPVDRFRRTSPAATDSLRGSPAGGRARHRFERGVSDGALLRRSSPRGRAALLVQARRDGARIVRIPVEWRILAWDKPREPRDPADPGYNFTALDAQVRAVHAAGLRALLVAGHAPPWAQAPGAWRFAADGSWAIQARALGELGTALARRYSGHFLPAGSTRLLPRVSLLQSWNEPNLPDYLSPQWAADDGLWKPWAPAHYRLMHNAFYRAVKAVQPRAIVATAGLAPNGDARDGIGRMAPVRFLRAFLCLDANGRPLRPRCSDPPLVDAVGFHPLSTGDPDRQAVSSLDVAVADIGKVLRVLRTARAAGILRALPPLWITEINWTTPAGGGQQRARWVARAFQRMWRAGADLALWQFIRDRPGERAAGMRTRRGRAKTILGGYRFPLDLVRTDAHHVRAWILTPRTGGRACVNVRVPRGWRRLRCARTPRDRPLVLRLHLTGRASVRATSGAARSPAVRIGR